MMDSTLRSQQHMRFYRIGKTRLWGDYGAILIHGMSSHLPRLDGLIQLERTGPFTPPITLPGIGDIVVTDHLRRTIEQAVPSGVSFAPVLKARIVQYRWDLWDRNAPSPAELPESGEPEDFILARPHSPDVAEQLGPLWEVILPEGAQVDSVRIGRGVNEYRIDPATWCGAPLFRPTGKRHVMATEEGKRCLEGAAGEWLDFQEATHRN
jgi:hypothetical protein